MAKTARLVVLAGSYSVDYSLYQLRGLVSASYLLSKDVHDFTTGRHRCFKNKAGAVAKIITALEPRNKR